MKRVGPGLVTRGVAFLVWVFFVLCLVLGIWMAATGRMTADPHLMATYGVAPGREWVVEVELWLGLALFAAFVVFYAWRMLYKGAAYMLYDGDMAVFVLSRRERRSFRWRDLASYGVRVRDLREIEPPVIPLLWGFFFQFPDGKRFPIRRMYPGYKELRALLVQKGMLRG